jgi:hypothetical protein
MRLAPVDLRARTLAASLADTARVGVASAVAKWVPPSVVSKGAAWVGQWTGGGAHASGDSLRTRVLWLSFQHAALRPDAALAMPTTTTTNTAAAAAAAASVRTHSDGDDAAGRRLYLLVGYEDGVAVWDVDTMHEVVSLRDTGAVRSARLVECDTDTVTGAGVAARPVPPRPHLALLTAAAAAAEPASSSVLRVVSLRTYASVAVDSSAGILALLSGSPRAVVGVGADRVVGWHPRTYERLFVVDGCVPSPLRPTQTVAAIGTRWLAYATTQRVPSARLTTAVEARGGMGTAPLSDPGARLAGAASAVAAGLYVAGERGAQALAHVWSAAASAVTGPPAPTDIAASPAPPSTATATAAGGGGGGGGARPGAETEVAAGPGTVMVVDMAQAQTMPAVVAHFVAESDPLAALAFNPSGHLVRLLPPRTHTYIYIQ